MHAFFLLLVFKICLHTYVNIRIYVCWYVCTHVCMSVCAWVHAYMCVYMLCMYVSIYAKQKHLGCKKRQGQSEAAVI